MTLDFQNESSVKTNQFSKLGIWYVLALSVIASVAIAGQILIQQHLKTQLSDSHVINVAGRQRMLSQRITKCALLLQPHQSETVRIEILNELQPALKLWTLCHHGLQSGNDSLNLPGENSPAVKKLFADVNQLHTTIKSSAESLVELLVKSPGSDYDSFNPTIQNIVKHQRAFLDGMDKIVFQYDAEAKAKVSKLGKMEYILLVISLAVIILEILFVFRPTAIQVNKAVNQLMVSERNAKKLSKEIGELHNSLEKSYEELSYINEPPESPKIYAKTDRGGNVIFISDRFTELSGLVLSHHALTLAELFPEANTESEWMDSIIERASEGNTWTGTIRYLGSNETIRWVELSVVPTLNEKGEVDEWVVLGSDITRQKQAEKNMREKNRSEVEKKINQQKFRSVLILEGQEEERKRLAMDIHDGIGQMLTSLKFQIESIDTRQAPSSVVTKLNEVQSLAKDIIKEVRRVTFNLKPTVLGDFGLQAAIQVFVTEIKKLTDIELVCRTNGPVNIQLPQKVENNIFRIVQEAINNAIKHSGATRIEVLIMQEADAIIIKVTDNGKGFDEKLVESRSTSIESGHGFFNMYERTEYINGKLEIKSIPGQETSVTLTYLVKNSVAV